MRSLLLAILLLPACTVSSGYDNQPYAPDPPLTYNTPATQAYSHPIRYDRPLMPYVTPPDGPLPNPTHAQRPNLFYTHPDYTLDPTHPYNRGRWRTTLDPQGNPREVWTTEPHHPGLLRPLPQDYPHLTPAPTNPNTRWNPHLRN